MAETLTDWAIELSKTGRKDFSFTGVTNWIAAPNSVKKLFDLEKEKIEMVIPYQLDSLVEAMGKLIL